MIYHTHRVYIREEMDARGWTVFQLGEHMPDDPSSKEWREARADEAAASVLREEGYRMFLRGAVPYAWERLPPLARADWVDILKRALAVRERELAGDAETELQRLRAENDRLRRLLAESPADCPYCKLPADRMGECAYGFPGCARADDMCLAGGPTMTPEMEAALAESNARAADEDGSFDEIEAAP